jgi:hypothetical protein
MKRFYCTICKKVKRVRQYPFSVENRDSENVTDRVGICTRHAFETSNRGYEKIRRNAPADSLVGHLRDGGHKKIRPMNEFEIRRLAKGGR